MATRTVAGGVINSGSAVRYYFNLINGEEVILDEDGIVVSSVQSALISANEIIKELRGETPDTAHEWQGWRLEIADASSRMVHSIPLDAPSIH